MDLKQLERAAGQWAMAGAAIALASPGKKLPITPAGGYWRDIARGDKSPPSLEWIVAQLRRGRADGIGVICGVASGNLEMVETDGDQSALLDAAAVVAAERGLHDLWHRVMVAGCVERTPSGGRHHYLRVTDGRCRGNRKLALPKPIGDKETNLKATVETRGQGGWVVCAPSFGRTHPTGLPYEFVSGSPADIPDVTAAERDALYNVLRSQCKRPKSLRRKIQCVAELKPGSLGERFAASTTWADILLPVGWTYSHDDLNAANEVVSYWVRPKKTDGGVSAVTGGRGNGDTLYVFTSTTPLHIENVDIQPQWDRYSVFAVLHFDGNLKAATRYIARLSDAGLSFSDIARGAAAAFKRVATKNNASTVAGVDR